MVVLGSGENAAYTAMGGGSTRQVLESAGIGGATAGALGGIGSAFSRDSGGARTLSAEGGGEEGGAAGRGEGQSISCSSFVAGTPVLTPGGPASIEGLVPGDRVASYDRRKGESYFGEVGSTHNRRTRDLINLRVGPDSELLRTTPEHPF